MLFARPFSGSDGEAGGGPLEFGQRATEAAWFGGLVGEKTYRFPDTPWDYHICRSGQGWFEGVNGAAYIAFMECLGLVSFFRLSH